MHNEQRFDQSLGRSASSSLGNNRVPSMADSQTATADGEDSDNLPLGSNGGAVRGTSTQSMLAFAVGAMQAPPPAAPMELYTRDGQTAGPSPVSRTFGSPVTLPPLRDVLRMSQAPRDRRSGHRLSPSGLPPIVRMARAAVSPLSQAPPPLAAWTIPTPPGTQPSLQRAQETVTIPPAAVPAITLTRPAGFHQETVRDQGQLQRPSTVSSLEEPTQADPAPSSPRRRVRFEEEANQQGDPPSERSVRSSRDISALGPGPLYRPRQEQEPEERPPKHRRHSHSLGHSDRPYLPRGSQGVPTEGRPPLFSGSSSESTAQADVGRDHRRVGAALEEEDPRNVPPREQRLDETNDSSADGGSEKGEVPADDIEYGSEDAEGETDVELGPATSTEHGELPGDESEYGSEDAEGETDVELGPATSAEDRPHSQALSSHNVPSNETSTSATIASNNGTGLLERVKTAGRSRRPPQGLARVGAAPFQDRASRMAKDRRSKGKETKRRKGKASSSAAGNPIVAILGKGGKNKSQVKQPRASRTFSPRSPGAYARNRAGDAKTASKETESSPTASTASESTGAVQSRVETATPGAIPLPPLHGRHTDPANGAGTDVHTLATGSAAGRPARRDSPASGRADPRPRPNHPESGAHFKASPFDSTASSPGSSTERRTLERTATSGTLGQPIQADDPSVTIPLDSLAQSPGHREAGALRQVLNVPQSQQPNAPHNHGGFCGLSPLHACGPATGTTTVGLPEPELLGQLWWQWMPVWIMVNPPGLTKNSTPVKVHARACEYVGDHQAQEVQNHDQRRGAQQLPPQSDAQRPRWEDWFALARDLHRETAPRVGGSTPFLSVGRPPGETPRHTAESVPQQPLQQAQQVPGSDIRWSHQPSLQDPQRPFLQPMQPLAQQAREPAAYRLSQPLPMPEASSTPTGPPHPIQSTMPPQSGIPQSAGHDLLLNKSTRPLSPAAYRLLRPFEAMFQLQDLALSHPELLIHRLLIITTRPEGCELALECLQWKSLRRHDIAVLAQFANVAHQYRQETLMLLRAYGGLDIYVNSTSEEVDYQMEFWRHKRGRRQSRVHLAPLEDAVQDDQQVLRWQPPVQPVSEQTGQQADRPAPSAFPQQQLPQATSPPPSRDTSEPSSASQRSIQQARPHVPHQSANSQLSETAQAPFAERAESHLPAREQEHPFSRQDGPYLSTERGRTQFLQQADKFSLLSHASEWQAAGRHPESNTEIATGGSNDMIQSGAGGFGRSREDIRHEDESMSRTWSGRIEEGFPEPGSSTPQPSPPKATYVRPAHVEIRQEPTQQAPTQSGRPQTVPVSARAESAQHSSSQVTPPLRQDNPMSGLSLLWQATHSQDSLPALVLRESHQSRPSQPGLSRPHPPSQP